MARTIPTNSLTELAKSDDIEPINIVEIQWISGGSRDTFADREIASAPYIRGTILELSSLDDVINVSAGSSSKEISITFDDTEGYMRNIFNTIDIHKKSVWVYQWFEGLAFGDRFLLFKGLINSPVEVNEADRTFTITILDQIENLETGFSPEEGQFNIIPSKLIGEPWPMAFGRVLNMPTISINNAISGVTQQGVGIISGEDLIGGIFTADNSDEVGAGVAMTRIQQQINVNNSAAAAWKGFQGEQENFDNLRAASNQLRAQLASIAGGLLASKREADQGKDDLLARVKDEENIGPSKIQILGGEDFPQGKTITVDIGGGFFTGYFNGQEFNIQNRKHPENDAKAAESAARASGTEITDSPGGGPFDVYAGGPNGPIRKRGQIIPPPTVKQERVEQVAEHFWAEGGSAVRIASDQVQNYIVSITPGTVNNVKAYKTIAGVRRLVLVPNQYWSQVDMDFNLPTGDVSFVQLTRQLSSIPDQGWEDDIYVTYTSSVGPNTVDIMEWLITYFSDLDWDVTSFNSVKASLTNFPSNFAVFDRPQIISLLQDIAFQCRCAIFLNDGVFFLKYLPDRPDAIETITGADIIHKTLNMGITPTEDLVTKMNITWRQRYAEIDGKEPERKFILRNNIPKYGIQEQDYDWFIYNQLDTIRHAATFWLIRLSNVFKRVSFQGHLNLLVAESYDAVTLDVEGDFFSSGAVLGVVESAQYNSDSKSIDFQVALPIKAGTQIEYPLYWPNDNPDLRWPQPSDDAGSGGIGAVARGELPLGNTVGGITGFSPDGEIQVTHVDTYFYGAKEEDEDIAEQVAAEDAERRAQKSKNSPDRGTKKPYDLGYNPQNVVDPGTDFTVQNTPNPNPNLKQPYAAKQSIPQSGGVVLTHGISIQDTPILDTTTKQVAYLSELIREITEEDGIILQDSLQYGDGSNVGDQTMKWDSETEKFYPESAFLKED